MMDRGFIKWQPFNSLISGKEVIQDLNNKRKVQKPILFPEEIEILNEQILDAYYSHSEIVLTFYDQNKIKVLKTNITKINHSTNLIYLNNKQIISFSQILHIEAI